MILPFKKRVSLCRDPFYNVVRHLEHQPLTVGQSCPKDCIVSILVCSDYQLR